MGAGKQQLLMDGQSGAGVEEAEMLKWRELMAQNLCFIL